MSVFELFESNLKSKIDSSPRHRLLAKIRYATKPAATEKYSRPSTIIQLVIKRFFDILISLSAILVLLPLLAVVATAIKLDSRGPVFFSQVRWGKDGRKIRVYKFRSMYLDTCDETGVAQTTLNDPRVTRVGAVLRRTNIDELPQLLNILKGDMSLIGPRCHVPGMLAAGMLYEDLVPEYHLRHQVRPGLTGLAQIRGLRGPTVRADKARARVAADLYYIDHFSLWLDFKILVSTVIVELRNGRGF